MVSARRGGSTLGCLFALLLLSAAGYFGVNVGEVFFRFYQYKDAMRQEVRFAAHNSDAVILRHLREQADSLGLPEAAGEVTLQRDGRHIEVESEYYEHIELPLIVREFRFNPHAEGIF
ncbi:MAG TPA: hypothetical protein VGP25_07565 [Gemmatimonadaceae bacterium]|jgi:hypothetical protein|nr:hypothetical protein [Gemmatimonadaceae bacterium]